MTDITPLFNGFLKQHETPATKQSFSVDSLDDFLKEAYRINAHISSLHLELRNIRQSYLSTAQPRRNFIRPAQHDRQRPLTDQEREEIDANSKQMLRELNASIRTLSDAESLRRETETTLTRKKFAGGLGALGSWAAGGGAISKSAEQSAAEDRANTINTHRESVLWTLRQRLQECVGTQQNMMEVRLKREMEKNQSVLAKARGAEAASLGSLQEPGSPSSSSKRKASESLPPWESQTYNPADDLTEEQVQIFMKENNDMLKHYESTLDQVRTAEKSLIEISELQTQLVNNLATQSAHIEQLVADSFKTTENVEGGNKQLKQATKKTSTAKLTFYATCGVCSFLILWDLVI
ncbi:snare-complex protein syntaxin-18 N-terminus-domain-containing protein [Pseudomassariella vexata]|uniref:Snare-complex protein syntaxin-18 N-terminus-domain-containing protein n=1 Tax=Pseudomassariella vexata TaxID=1141098 RepID=A0A1Y2DM18_9PEZI|nr:snare-complex protein syntaxin-18 N-terminus-domain-containing protein [Pseudomassariella vexata]ORY59745.1 snare-complex protein syntaxin-18 N-terminus-domain-containing protein [Pseudomassariella vexata]